MNIHFLKVALAAVCLIAIVSSCGDNKKKFTVEGTINEADSSTLYLERRTHSDVLLLDSVKLTNSGEFVFKQETLGYPEFYRLRLGKQTINFSIDSTESITIKADKSNFATEYTIEGSYNATRMKDAFLLQLRLRKSISDLRKAYNNKEITDQAFLDEVDSAIENYKEKASNLILDDYKSPAAYFLLFQKIDDMLIFDPSTKKDLNLFRAIATVWDTYYPTSPRTEILKNYALKAVINFNSLQTQEGIEKILTDKKSLEVKDFFSVSLPDLNGKEIATQSLKGKAFLLDFTAYTTEYSLAHNVRLNKIYEKYRSKLEIYQVSLDQDKHKWQNAASNLPWICVWDHQSLESPLIAKFNVEGLPTTYIFDKEGNILKRVSGNEDLEKEIAKVL